MPGKYQKKSSSPRGPVILVALLVVVLIALLGVALWLSGQTPANPTEPSSTDSTAGSTTGSTGAIGSTGSTAGTSAPPQTTVTTAPTKPYVGKVTTATITNTGDMLMHNKVLASGYSAATDSYDFSRSFQYLKKYVERADYAVANLEVTLAGKDNGYKYTGWPYFNSPDVLIDNLKDVGFDMLLTANNHCYDTGTFGFHRTQQVLQEKGMNHLGTVPNENTPLWQVLDINGIKVGMACYTYKGNDTDVVNLNGNYLRPEDSKLVSAFGYNRLDEFYAEMEANIAAMEAAGAEAIVVYMHWGNEYFLTQNSWQTTIGQKLCDLGVDVIVGGHPHVVQPMELLTSKTDPDHSTVCIYSMGNAISNQRVEEMGGDPNTEHTEDGVLFSFTLAKYTDGTVIVESVELIPTWVRHFYDAEEGHYVYQILPLDTQMADWLVSYDLTEEDYIEVTESYDRTWALVGSGLDRIQNYVAALVEQTEDRLGIS